MAILIISILVGLGIAALICGGILFLGKFDSYQ